MKPLTLSLLLVASCALASDCKSVPPYHINASTTSSVSPEFMALTFTKAKKIIDADRECYVLPKGYWVMACSGDGCYGTSKICFGATDK